METRHIALFASLLPCNRRAAIAKAIIAGEPVDERELGQIDLEAVSRMEEQSQKLGLKILCANDPSYPRALTTIDAPPAALFVAGNIEIPPVEQTLAIVGARNADMSSSEIASDFANAAVLNGMKVVSGLALGIDGAAHIGAMNSGIPAATIAIVANGLDVTYPAAHTQLTHRILSTGGSIISEYPPGTPPRTYHFLERNRLVAGLSFGVVVIQAGAKSGALVTARLAIEAGREVWVIPGSIRDLRFRGSNRLIQDGAHLISSPFDIPGIATLSEPGAPDLSTEESATLAVIKEVTQANLAHLLDKTGLQIGALQRTIQTLQQKGLITLIPGNFVRISHSNGASRN